jgi:hypothetical protein
MSNTSTIPAPEAPPDVEFEMRVLTDGKVGLRVPDANEAAIKWVRGMLSWLKADDPPEKITLRKLGVGPTGGIQVFPLGVMQEAHKGDLVLEGIDCLHEGQPGDGHWYVTLKVRSATTYKGDAAPDSTADLTPAEAANDTHACPNCGWPRSAPTVKDLLAAIADGRILAFSKSTPRGVAITFRDSLDAPTEQVTVHAKDDKDSPAAPPPPIPPSPAKRAPGARRPLLVSPTITTKPEEVSENSLRVQLVSILTEEYERPATAETFKERIFARILALVDPVSASKAQAHMKADWFVGQCLKVFDRKRMDRQDIVDLVDSIATGKGMRG